MAIIRKKKFSKKPVKKGRPNVKTKKVAWGGPEKEGITQSMMASFINCKERFRVRTIEGLTLPDRFNHGIEYGNYWHLCEEVTAKFQKGKVAFSIYEKPLKVYCQNLCREFPLQQEDIMKWFHVCCTQFPLYLKYWKKHSDTKKKTCLGVEETFCIPYVLPNSGRVVKLRGKFDEIDQIGNGIYLQENKTKGQVDEEKVRKQLTFDLQTMTYIVALKHWLKANDIKKPLLGIRYNVVRRPLSGGKGSIRQHKPTKACPEGESTESFYERLQAIIEEEPETFFMRWIVNISNADIEKFEQDFLNPFLENLCNWYDLQTTGKVNSEFAGLGLHWRLPYGIYNPVNEGSMTDIDNYLTTGSKVGLVYDSRMFKELV